MDGVWIPPACLVVVGDAADSLSGHAKVERPPVCALLVIIFYQSLCLLLFFLCGLLLAGAVEYVDVLHIIT